MQSSEIENLLNAKKIANVGRVNPRLKKVIVSAINFLGRVVFFYKIFGKPPREPKKILFISLFFNGDILMESPVFEMIKKMYPNAEMHIWIKSRTNGVLKGYVYFKKVIVFNDIRTRRYDEEIDNSIIKKFKFFKELRNEKYDIVFDVTGFMWTAIAVQIASPKYSGGLNFHGFGFMYNFESDAVDKGHLIDKYRNIILNDAKFTEKVSLALSTDNSPSYYIRSESVDKINAIFSQNDISPVSKKIVFHTTAGWKAKAWDIENYIELAKLFGSYADLFLIGGKEDIDNAKIITYQIKTNIYNFVDKLSINESAEMIRRADLYIGGDSGPLYIAEAVGTPTLSLFGPTNPLFSAPRGVRHNYIYNEMFCSAPVDEQNCKLIAGLNCRTVDCMKLISPAVVYEKAMKMLI